MLYYDINVSSFGPLSVELELLKHIFLLDSISAVVTLEQERLLAFHIELGFHRLTAIAYASRVRASDYVLDAARQLHFLFPSYLIITDDIDGGVGSKQSYLVNLLRIKLSTLNLHDVLRLQLLARHIHRN